MARSQKMAENSIQGTEKEEENFIFVQEKNKKTIVINFDEESFESGEKQKFQIKLVTFVANKLKHFLKKKGWFATPSLIKKGSSLKTTIENRCSMRDVVEDFRFYLRQYFVESCKEVMPPFFYTTQTALSQMVSTLGFKVVKPQNKFILIYHSY